MRNVNGTPISGFALCNALGITNEEVRRALREGRSGLGVSPISGPVATEVGAVPAALEPLAGALAPWDTRSARIAAHLLRELDGPLARTRARWRAERIAVILGTSTAGADVTEAAYRNFLEVGALPDGYDLWRHHTYGAILHTVKVLSGARGPAWVHSTACTSSAKPLASAQRLIGAGAIDAAIVGGIDTLCAMTIRGFHALGALDHARCRPFAADRGGINIGEGGAFLLLERDAEPLAFVEAVGETSDAYHISAPHPEGTGAALAMQQALNAAGVTADQVDHVNAHGTGTRLNDASESKAIAAIFGREVPVTSTKGYTGHTLGAAGATEAAIAIFSLIENWIPPSLGADPIDPTIEINVVHALQHTRVRRVMSNSFAFGGNNVSVLLRAA